MEGRIGYHFYRRRTKQLQPEGDLTFVAGYLLLAFTSIIFVAGIYMILLSKFMPYTGHKILDFIKTDFYYTLLIPCTLIIYFQFIYVNWVCMKFFRHN